jgi:hypothetical protein
VLGNDLMRDRRPVQGDSCHLTTRARRRLADRIWNAARLAHANSNLPLVVSDYYNYSESKPPATFDHFGHASNVDNALV